MLSRCSKVDRLNLLLSRFERGIMTHFCSPQATTAKVAARFKNHPQITLASKLHKSARTFHLTPIATRAGDTSFTSPKSLTLIFDGEDHTKPTQLSLLQKGMKQGGRVAQFG